MKFNSNVRFRTLGSGEIQNAIFERIAGGVGGGSLPGTLVAGRVAYNTDDNLYYFHNGTVWVPFASATDVSDLQTEIDNIEAASGTIFDTDGTYNGTVVDAALSSVTASTDLLNALVQMNAAITAAAGVDTLKELTDVDVDGESISSAYEAGQVLFYDSVNAVWKSNAIAGGIQDNQLLQWNATTKNWDNVDASTIGGNAFSTISGDTGSAVAETTSDSLALTGASGAGITTSASSTPDAITISLDLNSLTNGSETLLLSDEFAVYDGTATLAYTFQELVDDLNIVNNITADGMIVRTAADTYASRTIAASAVAGDEGISVVNGDGIAGNPTVGLDIVGLTAEAGTPSGTDVLAMYDGTNNVKVSIDQIASAMNSVLTLSELNDVSDTLDTGLSQGELMYYSGSEWTKSAVTALAADDVMTWTGSDWVNTAQSTLSVAEAKSLTMTAKKATAGTINPGQAVYLVSHDGTDHLVELAQANSTSTMSAFGIVTSTVTDTVAGEMVVFGEASFNTTGLGSAGDSIYVSDSVAGGLTNVRPTGAGVVIQIIGIIGSVGASGHVEVLEPFGRALPQFTNVNGYYWKSDAAGTPIEGNFTTDVNAVIGAADLADLADVTDALQAYTSGTFYGLIGDGAGNYDVQTVEIGDVNDVTITSVTNGEILQFNSTGSVWENKTFVEAGIQAQDDVLDDLSALSVVADDQIIIGTGAGTFGYITMSPYFQGLIDDVDESTFHASINLEIGTDVQAYDLALDNLSALAGTGFVVQTGVDTFITTSLLVNGAGDKAGLTISDASGVGDVPTLGLDINGLAAEAGTMSGTDEFAIFDGTNNVKATLTQVLAGVVNAGIALDDLSDVSNALTPAGVGSGNSVVLKSDGSNFALETLELIDLNNVDTANSSVTLDDVNVLVGTGTAFDTQVLTAGTNLTADTTGSAVVLNVDDAFLLNTGDTLTSGTLTIASGADIAVLTGGNITAVDAPTSASDLTNKAYVDSLVSASATWRNPLVDPDLVDVVSVNPATPEATYGLSVGDNVAFIATAAITFSLGTGTTVVGTGAGDIVNLTITSAGNGDYSLIETPLTTGDRFIIAGEHGTIGSGLSALDPAGDGNLADADLIQFTGTGDGSVNGSWTMPEGRSGQATHTGTEIAQGITVLVSDPESVHHGHTYLYDAGANVWVEIAGPGSIGAGTGLYYVGSTLHVGLGAGVVELPGDEVGLDLYATNNPLLLTSDGSTQDLTTGAKLHVRYDNSTIGTNGSTQLYVPNGGITETQLNSSVAGLGIAGGAGTALSFAPVELTAVASASGDFLVFQDIDDSDTPKKRAISDFISDHSILATTDLSATDGVKYTSGTGVFELDITSLSAATIVGADELVFDDGASGTHAKTTVTNFLADLDIVNGITTNGFTVRTAADTYTSRSIAVSGVGAEDGLTITNGDGVAGNPTVGLDITGTPALAAAPDVADELVVYDASGVANKKVTIAELADAVAGSTSLDELSDVEAATYTAGDVLVADGTDSYDAKPIHYIYDSTLNGGASLTHTVNHGLGQQFVNVTVYSRTATPNQIVANTVVLTDANNVTVTFLSSIECYVVVTGVPGVIPA